MDSVGLTYIEGRPAAAFAEALTAASAVAFAAVFAAIVAAGGNRDFAAGSKGSYCRIDFRIKD